VEGDSINFHNSYFTTMNNISFGKTYQAYDNGERTIYWIKCSDRMPTENNEYLVTTKTILGTFSTVDMFTLQNGFENYGNKVIAWCKKPLSFKE